MTEVRLVWAVPMYLKLLMGDIGVYDVNGPVGVPTLTVIASPLQLEAGMWEKMLASQYTNPYTVPVLIATRVGAVLGTVARGF